ncbi:hypothetical protein M407DRAFT_28275 [Tulasnella calospora MUT 4182]|uniref:Fatty acid synthase beta subunit AflB /Fas1-like central domain-containing protein n=1 Tax=Tulasnella calospora MUT 4182 TaxID=1051891 RepID=A0A0C3QB08_9AGAM|nr:hypothetical protein M407DRAFT_28275 [Tulasnella calospora MUT 4182]
MPKSRKLKSRFLLAIASPSTPCSSTNANSASSSVYDKNSSQRLSQSRTPSSAGIPSTDKAAEIIDAFEQLVSNTLLPSPLLSTPFTKLSPSNPYFPIICQWTGGRAGEDFHQPILATYGPIRRQSNISLVSGSGLGDSKDHTPFDGVLYTSCMTWKEFDNTVFNMPKEKRASWLENDGAVVGKLYLQDPVPVSVVIKGSARSLGPSPFPIGRCHAPLHIKLIELTSTRISSLENTPPTLSPSLPNFFASTLNGLRFDILRSTQQKS